MPSTPRNTHTHPSPHSGSKQGFLFGANDTNPRWLFTFSVGVSRLMISGPSAAQNTNEVLRCSSDGRMSKGARWAQRSALLCFVCEGKGGGRGTPCFLLFFKNFFKHKHFVACLLTALLIGNDCVEVPVHPFRHQAEISSVTLKLLCCVRPRGFSSHMRVFFCSALMWGPALKPIQTQSPASIHLVLQFPPV